MAARFLKNLDLDAIALFMDYARHPARSGDELVQWLQQRGVLVPRATLYGWLQQFRFEELGRARTAIAAAQTEDDIAAQTAAVESLTHYARTVGEARMLREDDEITPEHHKDIADRFRTLVSALGKSETWAARALGMSASVVSQVLSNTYKGDTDGKLRQIDKWIEQQHGKLKAPKPTGFVKTTTALAMIGVAKIAADENKIVVVYGPAGVGKTIVAQYLASEWTGSIYLTITEGNKRPTSLMEALAKELRLPQVKRTVYQLETDIIAELKDTGRLVIIDEIHTLVTGRSREEQSLNMLRGIQTATKCPMMWLGTVDFARYLEEGVGVRQGVDQIKRRVAFWLDLATPVLANEEGPGHHTIDDIRKIVAERQLKISQDGLDYLRDLSNTPGEGSLSAVDMLLNFVIRRGKGREITAALLQDFQHQRLGRAAATRVDRRIENHRLRKVG